jgi:hypothetical protein
MFSGLTIILVLSCPAIFTGTHVPGDPTHVRILVNDGVARPPPQCGKGKETDLGLCDMDKFVKHIGDVADGVDWSNVCGYRSGSA